jgi:hypothetical protein
LDDVFPLHKIKPVLPNEDLPEESLEIEKILDHKIIEHKPTYLVKWKDLPESENSWVPEHYFNSRRLIQKYNDDLSAGKLVKTPLVAIKKSSKKLGRPSKSKNASELQQNRNISETPILNEIKIRKTRISNKPINFLSSCLPILFLFLLFNGIYSTEVKGKFRFCELNDHSMLINDSIICNPKHVSPESTSYLI